MPRYEVTNTEELFSLTLDVPGIQAQDLEVSLEENGALLVIRGERKFSRGEGGASNVSFQKSFDLEDVSIVSAELAASLDNGVLTVSAPKQVPEPPTIRKIPISTTERADEEAAESKPEIEADDHDDVDKADLEMADQTA